MLIWSALFFITSISLALYGSGGITGRPVATAEFSAGILAAMLLVYLVGIVILWRCGIGL